MRERESMMMSQDWCNLNLTGIWIVSSSTTPVTIVKDNENHIISRFGDIYFPSISSSLSKCMHVQWLSKIPKEVPN
jgi:hypothetical protein